MIVIGLGELPKGRVMLWRIGQILSEWQIHSLVCLDYEVNAKEAEAEGKSGIVILILVIIIFFFYASCFLCHI